MLKYEKFRQTIRSVIQQSGLDVGIVYFILKDIEREIEPLYLKMVQDELRKEQEAESEQNETKEE